MYTRIKVALISLTIVTGFIAGSAAYAVTQNQINAEVQIVCPDDYGNWFSGSGTIIDPKGIILTNKHVVTDKVGSVIPTCIIGFVESISKEPDFGTPDNYNLAEVKYSTVTDDMDAAILYLDNSTNEIYPYVDIWNSNSNGLMFGDKIEVVGYPSIGGSTITYTSGDFSGYGSASDGTQNYIKATVPLEHGNSGGAAYNSAGQFIGVPTKVIAGSLNSLSYILSVNSIESWLTGILGKSYQQEIIEQKSIIETPKTNIQNDITPPSRPLNLHGQCYTDSTKFSYIYLGNSYADFNPSQSYLSTIYCEWTDFIDSSRVEGYYVYFGENINAKPAVDGVFTIQPHYQPVFTAKGRYHFVIQAKDNAGNISDPVIFGTYHYSMLEEDKKYQEILRNKIKQNEITSFSVFDYSGGVKGKLLATILYHGYIQGKPYKIPSNNLYIEWDGMIDKNFVSRFQIKFANDKFEIVKNNYITKVGILVNKVESFTLEASYTEGTNVNIPWLSKKVFEVVSTKSQKYQPGGAADKLKGNILLQVESRGEAWYMNPADGKRYYMKDGATAYEMMRRFGLGITNANLAKLPQEGEKKTYPAALSYLKGKILLQVESRGEAWYVHPKTGVRYYMKDGAAAYDLMRLYSLGITNTDLAKIPEGVL